MTEYRLKPGRLGKTLIEGYKNIEDKFVDTFLEEDGSLKTGGMAEKATEAYQKIEDAAVGGYQKIEDAFVDTFLEKVTDQNKSGVTPGAAVPAQMRSARYFGQRDVRVGKEPVPVCGDDGVLLRTVVSGVCGTDAAVWTHGPETGHRVEIGGQLGHETVARIAAVGKNVQGFEVGQRVYPYPLLARGDPRLAGMIGGFTDYVYVPKPVWGESLYAVDDRIPDRLAAFIEPFTVGYHAARQAAPAPGDNAVVFGAGTIGIAAALGLERLGAANVLVCDVSPLRLSIAEKLGFDTCNTAEEDAFEVAAAHYGTGLSAGAPAPDVACYVDAAGADGIVDEFIERGMVDSRFVMVAVNAAERRLNLLPLTYGSKALVGSGGYRADDVPEVMALMAEDPERLMPMITHEFPLERIGEALDTAADARRSLAVCVRMDEGKS